MAAYTGVKLKKEICIDELFTVHYFEYSNDFSFAGEAHNFWEFVYVDKGEIIVISDKKEHTLKRGEAIFHKPNEFHTLRATGNVAPNLTVISFSSSSPSMEYFENKIVRIDEMERNLLADIVYNTNVCFVNKLNDPYFTKMVKREEEIFGCEQLIEICLTHFLLHIRVRETYCTELSFNHPNTMVRSKTDSDTFNRISEYLEHNLNKQLSLTQICHDNLIGLSKLQKLFRSKVGTGVIDYFIKLKIDRAKQMIRMGNMNFTQISQSLGYLSLHYFSRQFKRYTEMTPSEYASSIKAIADI